MEINKLIDLNNFKTAPKLSNSQVKKLSDELEINISNADWITIGIMASCDKEAIKVLQSISKKYSSIKFFDLLFWCFFLIVIPPHLKFFEYQ